MCADWVARRARRAELTRERNVVNIVDKALRMGEGHQLKKLENVAKAVNALEDEISVSVRNIRIFYGR